MPLNTQSRARTSSMFHVLWGYRVAVWASGITVFATNGRHQNSSQGGLAISRWANVTLLLGLFRRRTFCIERRVKEPGWKLALICCEEAIDKYAEAVEVHLSDAKIPFDTLSRLLSLSFRSSFPDWSRPAPSSCNYTIKCLIPRDWSKDPIHISTGSESRIWRDRETFYINEVHLFWTLIKEFYIIKSLSRRSPPSALLIDMHACERINLLLVAISGCSPI